MLMEVRTLFNKYLYLTPFPLKINGMLICELHDFMLPKSTFALPMTIEKVKPLLFLYRLNTVSFRNYVVQDELGVGSENFV